MFSTRKHVQRGSKSMYPNYIAIAFSNIFQFLTITKGTWSKGILFNLYRFFISSILHLHLFQDNKPPASPLAFMLLLQTTRESPGAQTPSKNVPQIQKIDMIAVLKLIKHNEHRTAHYPISIYHTTIYYTRKAHILNLTPLSIPSWWHWQSLWQLQWHCFVLLPSPPWSTNGSICLLFVVAQSTSHLDMWRP